jgi:glycosyltransferase involved in cell wall biosynthesis
LAAPSGPTVSVVISVYNDVNRVESAIRSVLDQTYQNLEVIVVDDGSSDGTSELLDRIAETDCRVRVLHQPNAGLTRALIRGCSQTSGEFIARQDSDDWSYPQRIAEQVALLETDARIGFVSCATQYIGPGKEPLAVVTRATDPEISTLGLLRERQGPPAHGSVMFRRSLYQRVGGYREEFYFAQDSDLWLRMAEHALIGFLPDVRYVCSQDMLSTSGAQRQIQGRFGELGWLCRVARLAGGDESACLLEAIALRDTFILAGRASLANATDAELAQAYFIGSQLVRNRDHRARQYLWSVLMRRPWHMRAWLRVLQSLAQGVRMS